MKRQPPITGTSLRTIARLAACILLVANFLATPAVAIPRFVAASGSVPSHPYTSRASAAADIQTAVDACSPGDVMTVSNGTYTVGSGSNVVLITSGIRLQSANGPSVTSRCPAGKLHHPR